MRNFLDAVWWWVRLAALLVVAIYLIALIAMNAGQKADLWYWFGRPEAPSSIISLVLVSFLSGGVVFTTGWAMFKAMLRYRRTRAERRERAERDARLEMQRKAAMLRTKPAPTPIVRKPPAPATPPRAPLLVMPTEEPAHEPIEPAPLSPRDAETRAVTLTPHAAQSPHAAQAPHVTLAAPVPVPAATRAAEATPAFDAVEVQEDEPPKPLVEMPIAAENGDRAKLPPASPPPAGG